MNRTIHIMNRTIMITMDELFILVNQATQVFYCKDHNRPAEEWHVALDVEPGYELF